MRTAIRNGMLVFRADSDAEGRMLRRAYKRGHLHFVCKAMTESPSGRIGPDLILVPSIIRWQRPKKRPAPPRAGR